MKNIEEDKIIDGFESEEQIQHQEIYLHSQDDFQGKHYRETVKFLLPPAQQIPERRYSLQPDMLTGWSPRRDRPRPIPMVYDHEPIDTLVSLIHKTSSNFQLCYLGPRYDNTFYAWHKMPFETPYCHIQQPKDMKISNRLFCGQHPQKSDQICFDSFYEGANLDCVIKVADLEYDLYMRVDSNTKGHFHWFNFKMKNLKSNMRYRFNICNFQKDKVLYLRGMKPYMFSQKSWEKEGTGWAQGGENIRYERKPSKSFNLLEPRFRNYFKLSFQYATAYEQDELQVSYCIPYTYTDLRNYLKEIRQKNKNNDNLLFKQQTLCLSLGGLEVPLLIIHEKGEKKRIQTDSLPNKNGKKEEKKTARRANIKCVIVSGRVHPGQSNSSYAMEGFINFICSNHKLARQLRSNVIFKIIPMLNPDGVCLGNYRTGLSGKDFNREYINPDKQLFPEIYQFKQFVTDNKEKFGEDLLMYLDFHGHSVKKNVFMYGPQFSLADRQYYESRVFPKFLDRRTEMFRYYSCVFKITEQKKATSRALFLKNYKINLSFTIQASNGSYYDTKELKDIPFTEKLWRQMGRQIAIALKEYVDVAIENDIFKQDKIKTLRERKQRNLRTTKLIDRKKERILQTKQPKVMKQHEVFRSDVMKYIMEEIKFDEQKHHQIDKWSDDQISEGFSDKQDKNDDLDEEKLNQLYKRIKSKQPEKKKYQQIILPTPEEQQSKIKMQDFTRQPIREEVIEEQKRVEEQKVKNIHKRKNTSSQQSSYRQQQKAQVVNLNFQNKSIEETINLDRRPETSLNRKNFNEFVDEKNFQNKSFRSEYFKNTRTRMISSKKRQPLSSRKIPRVQEEDCYLNENVFKELSRKNTMIYRRSKESSNDNESNYLKCKTMRPIRKY